MELKLLFILSIISIAQCKLLDLTCKQIRAFVDGHNSRRLQIAQGKLNNQPAASEMNMVVWDDELAAKAAKWAVKSNFRHNPDKTVPSGRFRTGENLYRYSTSNTRAEFDVDKSLQAWFNEHAVYTYGNYGGDTRVGHYTQMAWSNTIYIGCAVSQSFKNGMNEYIVVCNYGPAGNYLNEKPYKSGGASGKLTCGTKDCSQPYGSKCKN